MVRERVFEQGPSHRRTVTELLLIDPPAVEADHVAFPKTDELRRDPATGAFESAELNDNSEPSEGSVVYRFDAQPAVGILVVDCEEMFGIDYTGVEALAGPIEDMRERDVDVRLARVHRAVLERLDMGGVIASIGEGHIFTRVGTRSRQAPDVWQRNAWLAASRTRVTSQLEQRIRPTMPVAAAPS
jgi:hypothetical protein